MTSGSASINNLDIDTSMDKIRTSLGVCPQTNVIYDFLTVFEHMQMIAVIKGVPSDKVDSAARSIIQDVGLNEKSNTLSKALSGGQKRKLCVGMALLGDSRIVFLDEPTSGIHREIVVGSWDDTKHP
jgi:ABC-type multidrug transport system ATPase subunit